jgi:hypothetical protein
MLDQALNASAFFRNESCGKCVPCRVGSQKLVEMAGGILQWQYDEESIRPVEKLLTELQRTMEMTSICGLGMVAGNPLISVFRHFREDLEAYLRSPRLRTISDFAALRGPIGTMGTMSDLSGLLAPKDKIPTHQDTMSDFEILGDPDHD